MDTHEFTLVAVQVAEGAWTASIVHTHHAGFAQQPIHTLGDFTFPTAKEALDNAEGAARVLTLQATRRRFVEPMTELLRIRQRISS
jgi:hypothetical protein